MASPTSNTLALDLQGISKAYGVTQALEKVDLSIRRGEVVALMGANGAGKSTLAKIAAGVERPDQGTISVAGRARRLASPRTAREAGIVVVHQSTHQLGIPGLSVAENLVLDGLCGGGSGILAGRGTLHRRAREVAARIGLDLPLDQDFGELGPAHRQLVAIARAVASDASVLILDEPTASLAAAEAERLFAVIDDLRERGLGILYISHRLADLRRIADRIVVLRNGRQVAAQTQPLDLPAAVNAMIGRDLNVAGRGDAGQRTDAAIVLQLKGVQLVSGARPFDLSVRAGEIVAVTGALGSGKSRLLKSLFGLSPASAGRFQIDGAPWHPKAPAQAISRGVFLAGEDRWRSSLLPPATPGADISGTIALPYRRRWFPFGLVADRRERAAADLAIATLGIRAKGSRDTLDLLSGGNQQKVVLGRWQAEPCRVLLLDEPFQGVDVGARRDLVAAIRSGRGDAATLVATSDVEEALEIADIVAVMRDHTVVGLHDLRTSDETSLLSTIGAFEAHESANHQGSRP